MIDLSVDEVKNEISGGCVVIDTRSDEEFASGFIPGSIFVLQERPVAAITPFLDKSQPIIVVGSDQPSQSIASLLETAGFRIAGVFCGSMEQWKSRGNPIDLVIDVDASELAMDIRFDNKLVLVDLRDADTFDHMHVQRAINIPLADLADIAQAASLDEEGSIYFYGGTGGDALTAASWMKKHGIHNVRAVKDGWASLSEEVSIVMEKAPGQKKTK